MAKKLDPKAIEAARKKSNRAERRSQKKQLMQEDIIRNQGNGGVKVIPPPPVPLDENGERPKLRVAAYCRVSTQEEEQLGSFEMQVLHFQQRIEGNPSWELVKIYKDEGRSGTTIHGRQGFQDMIADAVAGKIDLILTKSINRFGRNIVDILDNLRRLASLPNPVAVEFETEGIMHSGDGHNNLLIAILSALAEMESQQKSEAIKAGIRWRMAEGIYKFSVHNTLGYYRDHFGRIVIEPYEAEIVQYIYDSFLEGASIPEIGRSLEEQGIKSPMGKDHWNDATIRSILTNEKYCGDALMQKTYTKDYRSHRSVKNDKLNKYFKENHHAAIIPREKWLRVQELLKVRRDVGRVTTLKKLANRFMVKRVKDGLFQGFFILDSRWTADERRQFLKIIDSILNNDDKKGE